MTGRRHGKPAVMLACALLIAGALPSPALAAGIPPIEPFERSDRVLIISPHPDDDIIGCAGVIQRALKAGAKVKVVYTTCGDNNIFSIFLYTDVLSILFSNKMLYLANLVAFWKDHFLALGNTRMREAVRAEKVLGLEEKDLLFLGYPDHETDQMFVFNWDHARPYKESFSGYSAVPYEEGAGYGKEFTADNIIEDLKRAIADFRPTRIFVAHPSDINGDHWASYLYAMVSLSDLGKAVPRPKIYPYLVHVPGWPLPRNYHPELSIEPPEKYFGDDLPLVQWRELKLTAGEISRKRRAMLEHRSQMVVSAFYLLSFVRQNELFGDFPVIRLKAMHSPSEPGRGDFTSDMRWAGYAVVDGSFRVRIRTPEDPQNGAHIILFFAGFKDGLPFAKMPNVLVSIKDRKLRRMYNATVDQDIHPGDASLEVGRDSVTFSIPLRVLGNPDGMVFGFETDSDYMPEGCTAFRIIEIE